MFVLHCWAPGLSQSPRSPHKSIRTKPACLCCPAQRPTCFSLAICLCSISSSASELCDFAFAFLKFFDTHFPTGMQVKQGMLIYNWGNESTETVIDLFRVTQHVRNRAAMRAWSPQDAAHYCGLRAFSHHSEACY